MPETTGIRSPEHVNENDPDLVARRVRDARAGLTLLLQEAAEARRRRAEVGGPGNRSGGSTAVCAWNHFENIPTFYNWNNRPR